MSGPEWWRRANTIFVRTQLETELDLPDERAESQTEATSVRKDPSAGKEWNSLAKSTLKPFPDSTKTTSEYIPNTLCIL